MLILTLLLSTLHALPGDLIHFEEKEGLSAPEIAQRLGLACPGVVSRLGSRGLKVYAVTYETTDVTGQPTPASAAFAVPESATESLDVVSYQHGTTVDRRLAPSLNHRLSESRMEIACYGSQDVAVSVADYLGYGASAAAYHPYLHADTEASAAADALRAARQVAERLKIKIDGKLLLAGYSQGGHATMALHRRLQTQLAKEFKVTASVPMAGPYEPAETVRVAMRMPDQPTAAEGAFLIVAYDKIYGLFHTLDEAVVAPFAERLASLFPSDHSFDDVIKDLPADPRALFVPSFLADVMANDDNAFYRALRQNDVYDWKPDAPILFIHGTADLQVPPFNSRLADETMRALGGDTRVLWLEGKTHGSAATEATAQAIAWLNERRAQ